MTALLTVMGDPKLLDLARRPFPLRRFPIVSATSSLPMLLEVAMRSASLPLAAVLVTFGAQAADLPKELGIPEVPQRAWIVDDGGTRKSETELLLDNPRKEWMPVWVKISVPGRADCIE